MPSASITTAERSPTTAPTDAAATAWRRIRLLTDCYLALGVLTLAVAGLLGDHGDADDAVWTRGTIVVLVALITRALLGRAQRGAGRALLRLRLMTALQVVAIAAILAVPGPFPLWMRVEQGACGAVLLVVVVLVNGRAVRAGRA